MAHQRNRRGFNRHIAAAAHRDTDVRLRQRGRIVDTIADHRNLTTLALQTFNRIGFAIRQNARNDFVNTRFFGNRVSRRWVIPGEHYQTVSGVVQAFKRGNTIAAQWIAYRQ